MNPTAKLVLGEIRQPRDPDRRAQGLDRVIALDDQEVFYDGFWLAIQKWTFGTERRKCYYYRHYADRFFRESDHVRYQPLTQEEHDLFRPDLPMRLLRSTAVTWGFAGNVRRTEFERRARASGLDLDKMETLAVSKVVLIASPLQASGRGVVCDAENKIAFSPGELLWHADRVQMTRGRVKRPGIGLFRLGHQNGGIPSFLVGTFFEIPASMDEVAVFRDWRIREGS
jgi:hypothetical protein